MHLEMVFSTAAVALAVVWMMVGDILIHQKRK